MKAACKALRTSIWCTSISFVATIIMCVLAIVYKDYTIINIILNIAIGFLGSSFVALLLSIPAYIVAKRQVLERYWDNSRILIKDISNIDYLECDYNVDDVKGYIHEKNNREMFEKIGFKDTNDKFKEYEDRLIDECISRNEVDKKYAKVKVENDIEEFRNKVKEVCLQYIQTADNCSTRNLTFLLGDIEFFSGKKEYVKIYKNLYKPFRDLLDEICSEVVHFRLFINNKGNEVVVMEKILNLQNRIYKRKIKENDGYIFENVFHVFIDKMLINLENFRAMMYNMSAEKQKIYPRYCKTSKK